MRVKKYNFSIANIVSDAEMKIAEIDGEHEIHFLSENRVTEEMNDLLSELKKIAPIVNWSFQQVYGGHVLIASKITKEK